MCLPTAFRGSSILGCALIRRLPEEENDLWGSHAIVVSANAPPPADQIAAMPELRASEEQLMS